MASRYSTCGSTITGSAVLVADLVCLNTAVGITLTSGASLDCGGFTLSSDNPGGQNAIDIVGGGSVSNCVIDGFGNGIQTGGSGDVTISSVDVLDTGTDAISFFHAGTITLTDITIRGTGDDGISFNANNGPMTGTMTNIYIVDSGNQRLEFDSEGSPGTFTLDGEIVITGSGSDGIAMNGSDNTVTLLASGRLFVVNGNNNGIEMDSVQDNGLGFAIGSTAVVCGHGTFSDITSDSATSLDDMGTLHCNLQGPSGTWACTACSDGSRPATPSIPTQNP